MRALRVLLLVTAGLGVAGCDWFNPFDQRTDVEKALPFRTSLKEHADGALVVSVRADGASLAEVRESARYPVTVHCLTKRGSSDADWVIDPATGDWAVQSDGQGSLLVTARCRRA